MGMWAQEPPVNHVSLNPHPWVVSFHTDSGLGHVICFGQCNIYKSDAGRNLKNTCTSAFATIQTGSNLLERTHGRKSRHPG